MLDHRQSNPLDPHSRREEYPAPSGESVSYTHLDVYKRQEYLEQKENCLKSYYELKEKFIKYSNDTIHGK